MPTHIKTTSFEQQKTLLMRTMVLGHKIDAGLFAPYSTAPVVFLLHLDKTRIIYRSFMFSYDFLHPWKNNGFLFNLQIEFLRLLFLNYKINIYVFLNYKFIK